MNNITFSDILEMVRDEVSTRGIGIEVDKVLRTANRALRMLSGKIGGRFSTWTGSLIPGENNMVPAISTGTVETITGTVVNTATISVVSAPDIAKIKVGDKVSGGARFLSLVYRR